MLVIEGPQVDLISPFPESQQARIWGWSKAFSSLTMADDGPQTKEDFEVYMRNYLAMPHVASFGIIDRNNLLEMPHTAPLVGIIVFEGAGKYNGYFHVATTRAAWGTHMIDQAGAVAIEQLFRQEPSLHRVSATVNDKLAPAKALLRRLGFRFEGLIRKALPIGGVMYDVAHFGLLHTDWKYAPVPVVLQRKEN